MSIWALPLWLFFKNVSYKEKVKPWSHLSWKCCWNSSSRLDDMKIFFVKINYSHQLFRCFDISLLQKNWWRQHATNDVNAFYFQPTLNKLFNTSITLIDITLVLLEIWKGGQTDPSPEKNILKKPSLIRVKDLCKDFVRVIKLSKGNKLKKQHFDQLHWKYIINQKGFVYLMEQVRHLIKPKSEKLNRHNIRLSQ